MTTDQAVNRQADHENLIQEMREIIRRYVARDIRWEDAVPTGMPWTELSIHQDAQAVLKKVQS